MYQMVDEVPTIHMQTEYAMHDILHRKFLINMTKSKTLHSIARDFSVHISNSHQSHGNDEAQKTVDHNNQHGINHILRQDHKRKSLKIP